MKSFKILLIFICFILSFNSFSQREKFDCYTITKNLMMVKYSEFKYLGLEIKYEGQDLMKPMLLKLDNEDFRQLCIDTWSECNKSSQERLYNNFITNYNYISKSEFIDNIDYIMILVSINKTIKSYMK